MTLQYPIEMDGKEFKATTTNAMAIDVAFEIAMMTITGNYYESRKEAQVALVNEILRVNKIEL